MKVESEAREMAYRFVVCSAVGCSLLAIVAVFITLPLANQYISSVHQRVQGDMDFCKLSAKEVMLEMRELAASPGESADEEPLLSGGFEPVNEGPSPLWGLKNGTSVGGETRRKRRQVPYAPGQCEGCCIPGLPGPPGVPGRNGVPGRPGAPGAPGFPGRPPAICEEVTQPPCVACPPGEPGPAGPLGDQGNPGPLGHSGRPGNEGAPGAQGETGEPGPPGETGREGTRGEAGRPAISTPALPGNPGPAGEQGSTGLPGDSGEAGRPGAEGLPGSQGPPGPPGKPGPAGAQGDRGQAGQPGPPGERGICPKYCALDGGVFFEDGTRRR